MSIAVNQAEIDAIMSELAAGIRDEIDSDILKQFSAPRDDGDET
jgi:hypothetical protein